MEGYCHFKPKERVNTDVLIIGAGPAGLSAAIYASRAKLDTVVIDESMPGGQVATTFNISNYPGTNGVVRGYDLMENMKRQAESFNTRIDDLSEIIEVNLEGDVKHIISESVNYYAKTVIIATGAKPRKLPAKGSDDYNGRGIHYCATCDGALYQEADLLVVGGGNSAVEEAVFLTKFAKHISLVTRNDYLSAAKGDQNELHKNPNIDIMWNKNIIEVFGENFLEGAIVEDRITNEKMEIKTEGIFVYIGMEPKTEFLKNKIELDDLKYVKVNSDMSTNIKGVYAAGDVVSKKIRQISTAVGDGTVAGIMVEKYINRVG
ncbi:MAG: thioredoxin-disulfide reductase [Clostridiales bacterium]